MDPLIVERALTLVDPVSLLCFGCPWDEYSSEARSIADQVEDVRTRRGLINFRKVAKGVFVEAFGKLGKLEDESLDRMIELIRDGTNPRGTFEAGRVYRATLSIDLADEEALDDSFVCLERRASDGGVFMAMLSNESIRTFLVTSENEHRFSWRVAEVIR